MTGIPKRRPVKGYVAYRKGKRVVVPRHSSIKYIGRKPMPHPYHNPIIYTTRKPIPSSLSDDTSTERIAENIKENASDIAIKITEFIEYSSIIARGDFLNLLKKLGASAMADKINTELNENGIYTQIKEDYNLSMSDLIIFKEIIKKIIQKVIEYVADAVLKKIQNQRAIDWAKQQISEQISRQISNYLLRTQSYGALDESILPRYFRPSISIPIPSYIKEDIIKAQKANLQRSYVSMDMPHLNQGISKTAYVIHGAYGNPNENWFPWLKKQLQEQGYDVIVPSFPTPEGQTLANWIKIFNQNISRIDNNTIMIGHSVGVAFILRVLERINKKIKAVYLVSGFTSKLGDPRFDNLNSTFVEYPFNWEKIQQNCGSFHVFHSSSDPYVPIEFIEPFRHQLQAKIRLIKDAGHFNADAGYTKFHTLLKEILQEL